MKQENSAGSSDREGRLDARIDETMRERYAPPPTEQILKAAEWAPAVPASVGPKLWLSLATLAAIALAILVPLSAKAEPDDTRVTEWISTFEDVSNGGSAPVCTCDPACATFTQHCHNTFAQSVELAADDAVEFVGEPCCDLDEGLVSLVARCEGETVCLFVLLRDAAPIIHERIRRGLSIHRRDFGIFSAFELSMLPEPALLPHLVQN